MQIEVSGGCLDTPMKAAHDQHKGSHHIGESVAVRKFVSIWKGEGKVKVGEGDLLFAENSFRMSSPATLEPLRQLVNVLVLSL